MILWVQKKTVIPAHATTAVGIAVVHTAEDVDTATNSQSMKYWLFTSRSAYTRGPL